MILSDDVCLTKSYRATFDVEIDALLKRSVVRLQGPGGHAVVAKYRGVSSSNLSFFTRFSLNLLVLIVPMVLIDHLESW